MSRFLATPRFTDEELSAKMRPIIEELTQTDANDRRIQTLWYKEHDFDCFRYLMGLFIQGELDCSVYYYGALEENHQAAAPTLLELNKIGVITTNGQLSLIEHSKYDTIRQRSYLDFAMHVNDDFDPIAFSEKLYSKGINVTAMMLRPQSDDDHIIYWDVPQFAGIVNPVEACQIIAKCDGNIFGVTKYDDAKDAYTRVNPNFFGCLSDIYYDRLGDNNNIYTATIVSKKWDNTQCDEILLSTLTE